MNTTKLACTLLLSFAVCTGCSTLHETGNDLKKAGPAIKEDFKKVGPAMKEGFSEMGHDIKNAAGEAKDSLKETFK
jgi:predicted small secreted protein